MTLGPDYGETPLPHEELSALLPAAGFELGAPITRLGVHDLEQAFQDQVAEQLLPAAVDGTLTIDDLLSGHFLRDLHARLYESVWTWAGTFRTREVSIGVAPEQIAVELRHTLDNIGYRWTHTDDWTPKELGLVVHAEVVRIHPFADGNGRTTRLLGDLVFAATQNPTELYYDWA